VVGHRLAPVRHHERGVDFVRLDERLVGVLVLELMERGEPLLEEFRRARLRRAAAETKSGQACRHGDQRFGDAARSPPMACTETFL
jgi:hypothetical protein